MKLNSSVERTFWLSNLAVVIGLAFVFLLVFSAVILKYEMAQNALEKKEQKTLNAISNLKDEEGKNLSPERLNRILKNELVTLNNKNLELKNANLKLQDELAALKSVPVDDKSGEINALKSENSRLNLEISQLNESVKNLNEEIKTLKDVAISEPKIIVKNSTQTKEKLIKILKTKLNSKAKINDETGTLTLQTSEIFQKSRAEIKKESKAELEELLRSYFQVLLGDDELSKTIDKITIEGFTDSGGSYLRNLELSQGRAYEVQKLALNSYKSERLDSILLAYGRGYNSPIFKNGTEDKEASRRIEINFFLNEPLTKLTAK